MARLQAAVYDLRLQMLGNEFVHLPSLDEITHVCQTDHLIV
jgi:hypothetical protein